MLKKLTLPVLLSVVLAPVAFASITLDGKAIKSLQLTTNSAGNVFITSVPDDGGSTTTPPTCIDAPNDATCTGPTFCEANPSHSSCTDDEPEPIGSCTEGAELVYQTLNWKQQPGQSIVDIPKQGTASKFRTTKSTLYNGNITLVPTTGTGYVVRTLWISTCPGGPALQQDYNRCEVSGTEASLRWSQEASPRSRLQCKLDTDTVYYLNYKNEGCNTANCDGFRNTYHNGNP